MTIQKFGLRYERLLVLSAPISLACVLVAFVAIASDAASYKRKAACYDAAAAFIDANISELNKLWEKRETIGKVTFANEYVYETSIRSIGKLSYECDHKIMQQNTNTARAPADFSALLKDQAQQAKNTTRPVRSYGIEIPEKATISFLGTAITINILTLAQVMQLTLMPVLLLWLGSLFNTRYRETILIETAKSISDLYPHVINIYINARMPELRRKSWVGFYIKAYFGYIPAIFRIFLLSIFILPPTIFYCASLFYLGAVDYVWVSLGCGVLVAIFALINLLGELNPWHAGKTFPGPNCFSSRT